VLQSEIRMIQLQKGQKSVQHRPISFVGVSGSTQLDVVKILPEEIVDPFGLQV
jgi:hypothetical protein